MKNTTYSSKIDILLSTYNGSHYLEELILSLKRQTYSKWKLIVRDDGSTDDTYSLLSSLTADIIQDVHKLPTNKLNLGPSASFSLLLAESKSYYSMFCDQDDVWLDNKIEVSLRAMQELESRYGSDSPLMVHTDLKVTNASMQVLSNSFWKYQGLNPTSSNKLNRLLVQNVVTGCTVLINEPLRKLATPIPTEVIMHDWWLALVACAFGHIGYVISPTILYRQHSNNDTGAKRWNLTYALNRLKNYHVINDYISKTIRQTQVFSDAYESLLDDADREIVSAYSKIKHKNIVQRKFNAFKYRFYEFNSFRNLGFILFI